MRGCVRCCVRGCVRDCVIAKIIPIAYHSSKIQKLSKKVGKCCVRGCLRGCVTATIIPIAYHSSKIQIVKAFVIKIDVCHQKMSLIRPFYSIKSKETIANHCIFNAKNGRILAFFFSLTQQITLCPTKYISPNIAICTHGRLKRICEEGEAT